MSSHDPASIPGPTKILACRYGMFSRRWIDMCKRHGLSVQQLNAPQGTGAPAAEFQHAPEEDRNHVIKAALVNYKEDAPGVCSEVTAAKWYYRDTASTLSEAA